MCRHEEAMVFQPVSQDDPINMNKELGDASLAGVAVGRSPVCAGPFGDELLPSEHEATSPSRAGHDKHELDDDEKVAHRAEERRTHVATLAYSAVHLWKMTMTVADDDAERATINRNQRARLAALRREVSSLIAEEKKTAEEEAERKPLEDLIFRLQVEIAWLEQEVSTEEARVRKSFYNADEAMRMWEKTLREAQKVTRYNIEGTRCRYKKNVSCEACKTHFLPRNSICKCTQVRYCSKKCQNYDWEYGHEEAHILARLKKGLMKEVKEAKKTAPSTIHVPLEARRLLLEAKKASSSTKG